MCYIGVDLGGTNIAAGLVSENGEILYKKSIPTGKERENEYIIKDMALLCKDIIEKSEKNIKDIKSIGIGAPGQPDVSNGIILYSCNLGFRNVNIKKEMNKYIDLPIFIDNDANCAALGESVSGAAAKFSNSVTVTIGTGIGGGIIINNKIFGGTYFGGAEIGHMVIKTGGRKCQCGRSGCWETYSSATALINDSKQAAEKNNESAIYKLVNGDLNKITAKTPFDALSQGDETAKKVIDEYIINFAEGLTNIINIFQPGAVVIGGGVSAQGETLLAPIRKIVSKIVYGGELKTLIVQASLGNDAGIVGAAMLGKGV